jgi:hypothetical protein
LIAKARASLDEPRLLAQAGSLYYLLAGGAYFFAAAQLWRV